jgi:hypothetical protein
MLFGAANFHKSLKSCELDQSPPLGRQMPFRREEMISIPVCEIAAANLHRRLSSLLALPSRLGKDYVALNSLVFVRLTG